MKGNQAPHVGRLGILAAALLAAALSPATPAQSGRIIPTPAPTPEAELPPQVEEPRFVPDPNAEKYRLVFTTRRGGTLTATGYDPAEMKRARRAGFDNFVEGMNKAGAEGYRVVALLKGKAAVVAPGAVQYEYAWTETEAAAPHLKPGFGGSYALLSKKGFRLAAHQLLFGYCESGTVDFSDSCRYGDLFLFERRKGVETATEHAFVQSAPGGAWRKGPPHEEILTAAVREKLAEGFYPAHLISKFEILLEREPPDAALAEAGTEVRVVRSSSFWERDELPKDVNALARQGFRLALADNEIALMYRRAGAAAPLGYVWLKSSQKEFEKELARLQEAGATFRTIYAGSDGTRRTLVFEQEAGGAARREYRVLRFELRRRYVAAEDVVLTALAPASAGTQKELNRLAAEGFVVLALFDTDNYKYTKPGKGREEMISEEFGILLERRR
jgi:hypothetical protein